MQKEPTIHQLERLLAAFRGEGGNDEDLRHIAKSIIRDFTPQKFRPLDEVFTKENHPSIAEVKDFKEDKTQPLVAFLKNIWSKKYIKYPTIFIMSFFALFALLNFPLFVNILKPTTTVKYETVKEVVNPTAKSAELEPGEVIPETPTVKVPKIDVTAPLVFVNSIQETDIHEGLRNGLVHYDGTAKPGEVGNSFITGHSSNYWWEKGSYNYVFASLNKLVIGDQAIIYYNGNKYLYQVKNILVVEPTDVSVLAQTDTPTMTLMTCTPPGTSWKRLIVQFDQIAPKYSAPVVVERKIPVGTTTLPKSDSGNILDWIVKLFSF